MDLNLPLLDSIPTANSYPQDSNPSAPSASLNDQTSGGGFLDTAGQFLGKLLNYQISKDQLQAQTSLILAGKSVSTPMSAGILSTPAGGTNVPGLLLIAAGLLGVGYVAVKLLK